MHLLPSSQYFTGLECGHKFCMQCWGDYLTTKIIEEGMGQVFISTFGVILGLSAYFKRRQVSHSTVLFLLFPDNFLSRS